MQDKDFDRFIQQALENVPEPEYNPADWDKLEDQLHNLHGSQPGGSAAAAKTVGGTLGKLGFVASAILVTAVNVVLFTKPEVLKNSTGSAEKTAVTAEANNTPGIETAQADQEAATENTIIPVQADNTQVSGSETKAPVISETGLPVLATEPQRTTVAPARNSVATTGKQRKDMVNGSSSRQPVSNWAWSPVAAGRPGANNGTNNLSAGKPAAVPALVVPCATGTKASLAAVLVGKDTVRSSRFEVASCRLFDARFVTAGAEAATAIVTSNVASVLPGARLNFDHEKGAATLQWNPQPEAARPQPYSFTVWVADERCPVAEPKAYQFAVKVNPAFTIDITGNTRISKGQETELEVKGAPAGSTFRWLKENKFIADKSYGRLTVAPQHTEIFKVQVSSPSGCVYTDSVKVEVAQNETVSNSPLIPNIITPNNDGKNDFFKFQLPEAGPYRLEIIDRLGNRVYVNENYANQWNGEKLPAGIYYYILTIKNENKTYTGRVEVSRD